MVLASIGNGWGAFKLEERNLGLYSRRTNVEYKDYYKVLGLAKSATEKEIKAAYRKLARKHHPDMNQGNPKAEARFKEIGEAYEVLSDPEKRKRYDELGADWKSHRPAAPGAGGWPGGGRRVDFGDFGGSGAAGFSDFFSTFFGSGGVSGFPGFDSDQGGEMGAGRRASAEPEVVLTLEEVLQGATRTVELSESGPKSRIEVRIPPGVREGSRVRVAGEKGDGKRRREFHLRVRIAPHAVFERKGEDLQASVKVPLTTAVLGGEVDVPTLEGPVAMKIPEGTTVGQTFRLRGKGLPRLESGGRGDRGDILVTLSVDLPKQLSSRQRELFEELRRLGG
jgi:curved DNA-binding protein